MKGLVLIGLSFLSKAVFASQACPNISGTYWAYFETPVRYEQTDCQTLTRFSGYRLIDGQAYFTVKRTFELGGQPFCVNKDTCEFAEIVGDSVKFSYNFEARNLVGGHGECTVKEVFVSKTASGLLYKVKIESCNDGFAGEVTYQGPPISL